MRRTILHPRTLQPLRPVGYRKNGRAIWPILGGSEPPNQPPADPPKDPPADPPKPPADPPADKGFPEGTALEQMTVEQQKNYWKHYARQHESRADARSDYDEQKRLADLYREQERQQQTPSEQAVNAAKDEGKREGARDAYSKAAAAILTANLTGRGKTAEQAQALVEATNLAAFITDDGIDTAKVDSFVDSIASPATGGTPKPDKSQGARGGNKVSGVDAGRELFASSRSKTTATT